MKSIRSRLTLWYVSLLTITFVILGGAAYALLSYSLYTEMDNALKGVGNGFVERAGLEWQRSFPGDVDEIFRRFFGFVPVKRYIQMLDPLGHRQSVQPTAPAEQLSVSPLALENALRGIASFETVPGLEEYPVRVATVPIFRAGRLSSIVQVGMSLQGVHKTLSRFLIIMAALLPAALLFAGLGGWLLVRRALRPVDEMTAAATRISAEKLTERVEETGDGDELDRLAKTLNQMLTRLDAAFSQVRQFSANASHELQTPLTILRGELEVALRAARTTEEYIATIKSALEEIDRIARLVEGLLLLSRADAGVLRMDRRPVDMAELLEEVFWRLKVLADARSVRLELANSEPMTIEGDRERLRQLLVNIMENGIKYTRAGGKVTASLGQEGDSVCIQVSDTGIGMQAEGPERIFQPFYRGSEVLAEKGVGLGLSIAKSIVDLHGGRIEVHSKSNEGSTFRIILPSR
jgi:two-component system, OmpR family, sensor kinase